MLNDMHTLYTSPLGSHLILHNTVMTRTSNAVPWRTVANRGRGRSIVCHARNSRFGERRSTGNVAPITVVPLCPAGLRSSARAIRSKTPRLTRLLFFSHWASPPWAPSCQFQKIAPNPYCSLTRESHGGRRADRSRAHSRLSGQPAAIAQWIPLRR